MTNEVKKVFKPVNKNYMFRNQELLAYFDKKHAEAAKLGFKFEEASVVHQLIDIAMPIFLANLEKPASTIPVSHIENHELFPVCSVCGAGEGEDNPLEEDDNNVIRCRACADEAAGKAAETPKSPAKTTKAPAKTAKATTKTAKAAKNK